MVVNLVILYFSIAPLTCGNIESHVKYSPMVQELGLWYTSIGYLIITFKRFKSNSYVL